MLRTRAIRALLAALVAFAAGCTTVVEEPVGSNAGRRIVVETYPPPVDPVTLGPREPAPPPEPRIIDHGEEGTLVYTCRHTHCEVLREALEGRVSVEGTLSASPELNVLIFSDKKDKVTDALELLRELDRAMPQLLVEARIVEVTVDSDLEYELQHLFAIGSKGGNLSFVQDSEVTLTTPGSSPNPTVGGLVNIRPWRSNWHEFDTYVRLLVTEGKARLLSSPNLVVSAGREASIITGEELPIQSATVVSGSVSTTTQFKRVGIKLRVQPLQITGDTARLEINPEVSAVTGFTAAGATGVSNPIVAIRNVRTTLSLKDGEILTIGGLLREEDRRVVRRVPVLGQIPILGLLFQSRRTQIVKTQLVFFLRVNILEEGRPRTIRLHRPGSGLERLDAEIDRDLHEPDDGGSGTGADR